MKPDVFMILDLDLDISAVAPTPRDLFARSGRVDDLGAKSYCCCG